MIRPRFDPELTDYLLALRWWDWDADKIFRNVASDIPPYTIAAGNPCRVIRPRFDPELTDYLLALRWWDWDADKIFRNLEALCSGDLTQIRKIVP